MAEPLISIIVPAFNAEKTVKKCIESLLGIDYPKYDILVVDDGSTDRTKQMLFEFRSRARVIESQHIGPSKCRNIAAFQAQGEFLAFTDADCVVDKNWLKELLKGFVAKNVVAVGGSQESPADETAFGKNVQAFFELTGFLGGYIKSKANNSIRKVSHNPSCNVMYRKEDFLEIGGFDESLWPCEDVDLDYRLKKKGYAFMFNPVAKVYHYRPQSLAALSRMMFRYGAMQGILTKRYGLFRAMQFMPFFSVIFLILVIFNKLWLMILMVPILYVIFKVRNVSMWFTILYLGIISYTHWMFGFIKGLMVLGSQ